MLAQHRLCHICRTRQPNVPVWALPLYELSHKWLVALLFIYFFLLVSLLPLQRSPPFLTYLPCCYWREPGKIQIPSCQSSPLISLNLHSALQTLDHGLHTSSGLSPHPHPRHIHFSSHPMQSGPCGYSAFIPTKSPSLTLWEILNKFHSHFPPQFSHPFS